MSASSSPIPGGKKNAKASKLEILSVATKTPSDDLERKLKETELALKNMELTDRKRKGHLKLSVWAAIIAILVNVGTFVHVVLSNSREVQAKEIESQTRLNEATRLNAESTLAEVERRKAEGAAQIRVLKENLRTWPRTITVSPILIPTPKLNLPPRKVTYSLSLAIAKT